MPLPTTADVHFNQPLTNVGVNYVQKTDRFIANKVFAQVPVDKRSDAYWRYSKSDWRRTDAAKRAPGTESKGSGWNYDTDQYYCDVYAIHKDIEDQVRANADSNFKLDADATRFITGQLLMRRDLDWVDAYFKTGVWATEYDGVTSSSPSSSQFTQWDLPTTSDPLVNIADWQNTFDLLTGMDMNFGVLGANVYKALRNHPVILDRIKFTQRGVLTKDLIASFLDLPPDRLFIAKASVSVGPQINDARAQDEAADMEYIVPANSALFGFAPSTPSINEPSAGYTFTWKGYLGGNAQGIAISRFRMQHLRSDRVEAEMTYDMKVVSQDCGIFLNNVVSG